LISAGHFCNNFNNPTAPRRFDGRGVKTMLFFPSRIGRTSTTPPFESPDASRHHFGSVLCPTLETVKVSKFFTP
jgi:hypothetical protein